MERYFLIASTFCFLVAVLHTVIELRTGVFRPKRFNFLAIGIGFIFQTAFLWIRGQALGRCPITNLFEVFVFLAWSVALVYLLVGPAYRLSLMGAFTAPLVLLLQGFALISPIDTRHPVTVAANSWLEFHASLSLVAYGVFALACIAGVMYSAAGAPAEDAPFAFDFLSFTSADELVCRDHAPAVVGFCALHRRHREWLFYRSPVTPHSSRGCDCALVALRGNLASPSS